MLIRRTTMVRGKLIAGLDSAVVGWCWYSTRRKIAVYDLARVRNALEAEGASPAMAERLATLLSEVDLGRNTPLFVEPADADELRLIEKQERKAAARRRAGEE